MRPEQSTIGTILERERHSIHIRLSTVTGHDQIVGMIQDCKQRITRDGSLVLVEALPLQRTCCVVSERCYIHETVTIRDLSTDEDIIVTVYQDSRSRVISDKSRSGTIPVPHPQDSTGVPIQLKDRKRPIQRGPAIAIPCHQHIACVVYGD